MAIFRKIHTSFWSDPFIQDLDNDHKLFYLYLLTNEKTKQCGIYEISKKQISFELGYSIDRVSKLLTYFIKCGKILYSETTKEIAIKNWNKFNGSTSPKVVSCILSELKNVKDRVLIEYVNGMYTASQEEQEEEEEQEPEEKVNEIFNELWELYDKKVSKESSLKAFKNVPKKAYDDIRKNIPLFIKQFSDKQFQPHFSTYLNGKRWQDELKQEAKATTTFTIRNKATLDDD
jgi:hypothetical protein